MRSDRTNQGFTTIIDVAASSQKASSKPGSAFSYPFPLSLRSFDWMPGSGGGRFWRDCSARTYRIPPMITGIFSDAFSILATGIVWPPHCRGSPVRWALLAALISKILRSLKPYGSSKRKEEPKDVREIPKSSSVTDKITQGNPPPFAGL
jgi:hypothetical protein